MNLKTIAANVAGSGPDTLMTAGAAVISFGIGLIYMPAGVISGGLFLLVSGLAWAGGKK